MRMQDIRTTVRFMRTRPLFAIGTVSMLSLGLGATIAIASVINSVLLRPLPFPEPDRLVRVDPEDQTHAWGHGYTLQSGGSPGASAMVPS